MSHLGVYLVVQLFLAFGLGGLFWPEKVMPVFDVLMFPWPASYRMLRAHSVAAIGVCLVLIGILLSGR